MEGLTVRYGGVEALVGASLQVQAGELLALLGPSGSGKTTLLHAAAGFVTPSAGRIAIAGQEVSGPGWALPPEKRSVGLVFQSYALWPHLSARETVAYPLQRRGAKRRQALKMAQEWLDRVGLSDLGERRPAELSGGQQQRVGLARALASSPRLFLLDEPTANLDQVLKASLQQEIVQQQRATGAGAIYVTHDPSEALALADRVAVLREGRVVQIAEPEALYTNPVDGWTASFTGPSASMPVSMASNDGMDRISFCLLGKRLRCRGSIQNHSGSHQSLLLRPEWCELAETGVMAIEARVMLPRYQGSHTDYVLDSQGMQVVVRSFAATRHVSGDAVSWEPRRAVILMDDLQDSASRE